MILKKLKSLLGQYNNSTLSKNIVTVFSGTAISQVIQVIGAPVLALYFSASEFGVFALYVSFASLISIVATARYEMAIVLPEKQDDSKLLVIICFIISLIISVLSFLIIYPLRDKIAILFTSVELENFLVYVPVSVLCTGIFQTLYYYILRKKHFNTLSALKIFQTAASVICPVVLWYTGYKAGGMIAGYILSQVLCVIIALLFVSIPEILKVQINISSMKALLEKYKNFPQINSLHAFTDNAQSSILNFIISYSYGNSALGFFSIAYRVLRAPMGVISAAVSQVLFQQMSDNYNKKISNYPITIKVIKYLSFLSIPLFIIIALVSPWLFKIFFKPEWAEAGKYIIYLTPWIAAAFVSSPLSHLPNITSKQLSFLTITIIINVFSFILFYLLFHLHFSIYISLLGFSLVWFFGLIILLVWFTQLSKRVREQAVS